MRHAGVIICGRPIRQIKPRRILKHSPAQLEKKNSIKTEEIEVIVVDKEEEIEEPRPLIIGTGSYLNIPKPEEIEDGFKTDEVYSSPAVETAIEVLGKIVEEEVNKEKKSRKKRKYTRSKKSKKSTVVSEQD